jgi:hypothetical protein
MDFNNLRRFIMKIFKSAQMIMFVSLSLISLNTYAYGAGAKCHFNAVKKYCYERVLQLGQASDSVLTDPRFQAIEHFIPAANGIPATRLFTISLDGKVVCDNVIGYSSAMNGNWACGATCVGQGHQPNPALCLVE